MQKNDASHSVQLGETKVESKALVTEWVEKLELKYGDRRRGEYREEKQVVTKTLNAIVTTIGSTYTLEKPLAVGGTGIVFVGNHNRFPQPIVLKFNRPNLHPDERSMVANEASILPSLSHPNIIRVLDVGQIELEGCPKVTYLVEPFIAGSMPFFNFDKTRTDETWLKQRIEHLRRKLPDTPAMTSANDSGRTTECVNALLADIGALFAQWVSLIGYLHGSHPSAAEGYVYLDVKPENVLVDEHGHLTAIDFGSVEHLDREDDSPVEVFFTERYAHQALVRRKKEKASSNRVRGGMKRSELSKGFDYYALGTSMLELLNEIGAIREHLVPQLPLYRSLHFLATRLLDRQNSSRSIDNHYPLAPQVFPGLRDDDYETLSYATLTDVERDLEKERGRWNLEDQVPELATYSKDIVRVVPGFNTVLTQRLRGLIEHPLVARLKYVTQLGLVSLVYPTADHARYDHSLGSYTYTTNYVKSLFNDLGNPVFRNLISAEDLNAVLVAALLHDLGQYPLAHDLEEVHERIFKHGRIGMLLLEDSLTDRYGRTLKDIVEDPRNGWGVPLRLVAQIVGAHSRNVEISSDVPSDSLKIDVLAAIIDGPVDADKADYIVRDSARCELPYGSQIDLERLLRVLTVAIIPDEASPVRRVTLGVYDKGLVSAHAFGQARYQLLSTVYWHHTVRIAKSMLQYATALGLPREVFGPSTLDRDRKELEIRERLVAFIKALVPPFISPDFKQRGAAAGPTPGLDLSAEPPEQAMSVLSGFTEVGAEDEESSSARWYPGLAWTDWLMLQWISGLSAATVTSRNLVYGLQTRTLYKRVATFARGGAYDDLIRALEESDWPDRVDLCMKLHKLVRQRLERDWHHLPTATSLSVSDFDRLCETNLLILIDIPRPSKKIGYDRPLGVVPELKEKSYHQDSRQATEDKRWRQTMAGMIEGIAPVRVLCHPEVRNLISAHFSPVEGNMAKEIRTILGIF